VRPLTARDVDKRWLADGRLDDQYPYLPIQDPLPAERRRGHPKIMPVFPKDLPRQLHLSAQPATPGQASAPAPSSRRHGNSSRRPRPRRGRKSATRRLAPSTQRIPSSFKEAGDILEQSQHSSPIARVVRNRKTKKTAKKVAKRTAVLTVVSDAEEVGDAEDAEVVQGPEMPAQPVLRKTRSGRVVKPTSKVSAKTC
jgi:hypothetical protein